MLLCHFIPVAHGAMHHASLASVNLGELCMLVALTKQQLCQKCQQSQQTPRMLHLYAHIIVNADLWLPQPAHVHQLNSSSSTHPTWLTHHQSAFRWLICLRVTDLHRSAANRCAWASHRRQQMAPQLWLSWVLTVSCRAADSPAQGVKLGS